MGELAKYISGEIDQCALPPVYSEVRSDHIINSGAKLPVYLSLLFTVMLRNGLSPAGMLIGTMVPVPIYIYMVPVPMVPVSMVPVPMVPIPKGKWINQASPENFRAITLSNVFGKLLDSIIMKLETDKLQTNELQFGFKTGSSASLCASMVQETVSHFVHIGEVMYMLDCQMQAKPSTGLSTANYFAHC